MPSQEWAETQAAFRQASAWFTSVVATVQNQWDAVALGEWTVRDLAGHTSRALLTVETYLDQPAAAVQVNAPAEYFTLMMASVGDPEAVAQRGRDAGAALGADPAVAIAAITDRVLQRVQLASAEALVATPVGGMHLRNYLPTRTFELTVHTCDLAVALGQELAVPPAAALQSLALVGDLAVRAGIAGSLLLSATGRITLPNGFTVL